MLYSHKLGVNKRRAIDEGLYPVPELAQPRRKFVKPRFVSMRRPDEQSQLKKHMQSPPPVVSGSTTDEAPGVSSASNTGMSFTHKKALKSLGGSSYGSQLHQSVPQPGNSFAQTL